MRSRDMGVLKNKTGVRDSDGGELARPEQQGALVVGLVIGVLRPLPDRLLHIDHRVLAEAGHRLDRGPMGAGRTAP